MIARLCNPFLLCLSFVASASFARADAPMLQSLTRLDPVAIAPIHHVNGAVVVGPSIPVPPFQSRITGLALAFDQFQGDQSSLSDFPPVGANLAPCNAPSPENRYIFGSSARNVHFVTDFANAASQSINLPIHTVAFAWFWNPSGASQENPSTEYFAVDIDWWREFNAACDATWSSSPDSITAARGHIGGVRIYFNRPGTPGGHYSVIDISALNLPPMPSASGAVEMKFLQFPPGSTSIPSSADYSTRAQPYLWGTQADISPPPYLGQPRPGGPGFVQQWNDNAGQSTAIVDGVFTANECQNYSYAGLCYNPLGPMIAWFYQTCQTVPPFTLSSPANGAFAVPREALFTWNGASAPPGTTYEFEIRRVEDDMLVFSQPGLTFAQFQMPAGILNFCQNYRWKVIASADAVCPSTTACPWTFRAEPNMAADFNHDLSVDFFDYLDFVDAFSSGAPEGDFNLDGTLDFFDYLDFVDVFAQGC